MDGLGGLVIHNMTIGTCEIALIVKAIDIKRDGHPYTCLWNLQHTICAFTVICMLTVNGFIQVALLVVVGLQQQSLAVVGGLRRGGEGTVQHIFFLQVGLIDLSLCNKVV